MQYYFKEADEVMHSQGTSDQGLSADQASKRLEETGKNKLEESKKKSLVMRLLDQMKDPMVIVLIAAAAISGLFNEIADMVIILVVVILNAVLGCFQESKAEHAIEALQKMSAPHTKVRRNNAVCDIKSEDVVVGDIVLLEAGDSVPADMRLTATASLKIEEAALTGESVAVEKNKEAITAVDSEVPLGDRFNMAYMGTNVAYGRGEGVVTATGMSTEMGKIAGILAETKDNKTPLQIKLASLSKILSILVIAICVVIFAVNIIRSGGFGNSDILEMLLTSVSLAVAAIPEGLVVVVTILLSIGVTKMSKHNSIIRRLTAVETLGCTQIICSDKTGTLTQNKMTVVNHYGDEALLAEAMALCTDVEVDDTGDFMGEATELALVIYADKLDLNKKELESKKPRIGEVPFDSDRKLMSTVHQVSNDSYRQYTKGAPDEILKVCTSILAGGEVVVLTEELKKEVSAANKGMADKALRVLGAAYKDYKTKPAEYNSPGLENNMTFIGLTGMIDPIRPEVKDAIAECKDAGIRAIMITGDHRDTAVAIAKELEILGANQKAITGAQLSEMSDEEFEKTIETYSVYARVQPEHKVRIVNTWHIKGKVTAMTGDGVNDAPALKSADIGVGMGITGTDVTKNVADMVLTDDNFASIVNAAREGRRIYENIRKAIQFLLASNLSEVLAIFIATLANVQLFAPIHILWINLVTDTFPAMALGMEEAEDDIMKQPPRDSKEGIFADGLGINVVYQGILVAVLTLISYFIGNDKSHITGMTMAFFTLSMCEVFHAFNLRSRKKSIFKIHKMNMYLVGAAVLSVIFTLGVIYIPGLNTVFRLTALSGGNLLTALGLAVIIIPAVEIVKLIQRK